MKEQRRTMAENERKRRAKCEGRNKYQLLGNLTRCIEFATQGDLRNQTTVASISEILNFLVSLVTKNIFLGASASPARRIQISTTGLVSKRQEKPNDHSGSASVENTITGLGAGGGSEDNAP